ncbi:MAG: GAF domain-containing protein [Anaerolineales bacterium]|nr:GAF domain-containing protein [Anaerolineales bacterium]
MLRVSVWVLLGTAVVIPLLLLLLDSTVPTMERLIVVLGPSLLIILSGGVIRWLVQRRHLQIGGILLSTILFIAIIFAVYNSGAGISSPSVAGFVVVIILAASLSEGRFPVLAFTLLSVLVSLAFLIVQQQGLLKITANTLPPVVSWVVFLFVFVLSGALLSVALRRLNAALDRAQQSEQSLREMTNVLEIRVAERTKALETSAEISRRLSTILDQEQLVVEVVREVQRAFGYYHTHIYLLDEKKQNLVLAGGTGEAGRMLLTAGHKMPISRGLVGEAAQSRRTVLVPDVHQRPEWVSNRLLPETAAEIAVPILLGHELKGILDVQHNVVNGLTESDRILLESITNQVAVALENARLYADAQERGQREALVNAIGQKIQRAGSVDAVLQIAIQELGQALDSQTAKIQIGRIES